MDDDMPTAGGEAIRGADEILIPAQNIPPAGAAEEAFAVAGSAQAAQRSYRRLEEKLAHAEYRATEAERAAEQLRAQTGEALAGAASPLPGYPGLAAERERMERAGGKGAGIQADIHLEERAARYLRRAEEAERVAEQLRAALAAAHSVPSAIVTATEERQSVLADLATRLTSRIWLGFIGCFVLAIAGLIIGSASWDQAVDLIKWVFTAAAGAEAVRDGAAALKGHQPAPPPVSVVTPVRT